MENNHQPPSSHPVFIWLILALGAIIRLFHLGQESLWLDEIESVRIVHQSFSGMMDYIVHYDSHPPLYYLLLHGWIKIAGTSEASLRLLSAGFGTASIGLIYLAGRRLFDTRTGLTAALFLALSPFHLYYSQEARMYALFGFFSLLMLVALWEVSRHGSRRWRVLLVMSSVGALLTQNLAVILILLQNVWYLGTRRTQILTGPQWLKLQGVILSAFLLWVPFLFKQIAAAKQIGFLSWIQAPTFGHLAELLFEFCGAFPIHSRTEPTFWYFLGAGIPALLFLVFALFPMVTALKQRLSSASQNSPFSASLVSSSSPAASPTETDRVAGFTREPDAIHGFSRAYLALWFLLPVLLPFFASLVFFPVFIVRACIPSLFVVFLVLARGVAIQPGLPTRALLLCLIIGASLGNIWLYDSLTVKSDWRQASATLDRLMEPQSRIFFFPAYIVNSFSFYSTRADVQKAVLPITGNSPQEFRNHLAQTVGPPRRFWLVTAYLQEEIEPIADGLAHLFHLETKLDFPGVQAYQFSF